MNQNHTQPRFEFGLPPNIDMSLQQTLHSRQQQQHFLGDYINGGSGISSGQSRKAFDTIHPNGRPHSLALDPSIFQQQQSDEDLYSVLSEKC